MSASRTFKRSFDSLAQIFDFTSEQVETGLRPTIDLVLEEIFTNVVKYGRSSETAVRIDLARVAGGVEVTLTDYDADFFDVTRAPDVDINLPIEQRKPGGLGIHLVRKLVDSIEYRYSKETRESRITFRKTLGEEHAHD